MAAKVEMYTKTHCPYCVQAKELLKIKKVTITEYNIEQDAEKRSELMQRAPGVRTVPQIFINDKLIGGFDDLSKLDKEDKLDTLLS